MIQSPRCRIGASGFAGGVLFCFWWVFGGLLGKGFYVCLVVVWLIELVLPVLFWPVVWGVVGAVGRVAVQVYRDGVWPESLPRVVSLVFLGALGGALAGLLGEGEVGWLALGYGASDIIENLLASKYPKPE